jgi:hypothetical protein
MAGTEAAMSAGDWNQLTLAGADPADAILVANYARIAAKSS